MARTNWLCEDCLAATPKLIRAADVVDHIVPLSLGGEDVDANTRNLCHHHHDIRTAEQFGRDPKPERDADGWPIWKRERGST
jgi:5-methylcytosine-specific restriction protein A